MERILCTLAVAIWCMFGAWLAGVDFDSRGVETFLTFLYTTVFTVMTYTYPGWNK